MDRTIVTRKFDYTTPPLQLGIPGPSYLSPADWQRAQQLLSNVVKEGTAEIIEKLSGEIHRASVRNKLLQHENEGLLASLDTQNKRTRNGRRLPFKGKDKKRTDGVLYTPA